MAEIVERPLGVVGSSEEPFSGRLVVRVFPHGDVEALYVTAPGPSECERLNAWLQDAGIDNRVTPKALATGHSYAYGGGSSDPSSEAEAEANTERVARRAKQRVRWCLKAVGADRMLTLTWRENMTDVAKAKSILHRFIGMCRKRWPGFQYVGVPEPQERGAMHWHIGVRGHVAIDTLRGFWWRALGCRVRFIDGKPCLKGLDGVWSSKPGDLTPGNVHMKPPRSRGQQRRTWQADRMAQYMAKYISKTIEGGTCHLASYSATRGLSWRADRYAVRAEAFTDVAGCVLRVLNETGANLPYLWTAPDRRVIWASGLIDEPPPDFQRTPSC